MTSELTLAQELAASMSQQNLQEQINRKNKEATIMKPIAALNKGVKKFNYEATPGHTFITLEGAYMEDKNKAHIVRAFYTNKKGKFGDNEVAITDEYFINLPKHLTAAVKQISETDEYLQLINAGKFVFTVYEYEYSGGKKAYSVNWGTTD